MGILKHWRKALVGCATSLIAATGLVCSMRNPPQTHVRNSTEQTLAQKFRVMTANVARGHGDTYVPNYFFPSNKSTEGMRVLEDIIREENIDIGCFQEIENAYTHGENQPADIARNTQLKNYVFGENFSFNAPFKPSWRFADGNSINSRAKLHNSRKILFYDGNPSMIVKLLKPIAGIRGFIHAEVYSSVSDYPINIICTHLSSFEFDEDERDFEMEAVFEYAANHTPVIVMGDLNTPPSGGKDVDDYYPPIRYGGTYRDERGWSLVKEIEKKYGVTVHYDPRLHLFDEDTFPEMPTTNPGPITVDQFGKPFIPREGIRYKVIDYVLLVRHPDDKVKVNLGPTKVYYDKLCSDHTPVIADVEVIE